MKYIIMYLAAITAANLIITTYGPAWSIITAFVFIGLDLISRDALHERWRGGALWRNMAVLIAAGSIISFAINTASWRIGLASFVAFAAAGAMDTVTFHKLIDRPALVRMNGSNIPAAAVDSLIFPLIAFGWPPLLGIMAGQFVAKVAGGAVWSLVFHAATSKSDND